VATTGMTILFVWTVLASDRFRSYPTWKAVAEFNTPTACQSAATVLQIDPKNFRCVAK
jgi:hypothetical protein